MAKKPADEEPASRIRALEESEAFLRALLRTIPDLVWLKDPEGKYLYCNPNFEELSSVAAKDLLGKTDYDIAEKANADEYRRNDVRAAREGKSVKAEEEVVFASDGHREILETIKTPVYGPDGRLTGVLGIGRDITARKQLESERLASLAFFENMDRVNRIVQGTADLDRMMRDVLDAVLSIFGCDRAFLAAPVDPESPELHVRMHRTNPAYSREPGKNELTVPASPAHRKLFRELLENPGPHEIRCGSGIEPGDEPWKTFGVKSQLAIALYPKVGKPWEFGLHQCSHARRWTPEEKKLFLEIGRRLADGLTGLLMHRDLQQNREFLDNIVENLPNLVFVQDANTFRFLKFNRAGERLIGYSPGELVGKTEHDLFPKEIADSLLARTREALETGKPVDTPEETIRTANGEERVFHTQKIPILDRTGRPEYLLGISEDITERKRNELELNETRERLQSFLDSATDAMSIYDRELRLVDINRVALSYNPEGTKKEDLLGKTLEELMQGFDTGNVPSDNFKNVLETGIPFLETVCFVKDGRKHWVIAKIFKAGNGLGILTSDITALKAAEEEANDIKERLQTYLNSATDLMLVLDSRLDLVELNREALAYFPGGTKREDLLGKNAHDFMKFVDNRRIPEIFGHVLATGSPHFSEELIAFRPDNPRWFNVRIFRVGDGLGVIANDITEQKTLEEQLRQAQKMESIGRLAGGVAHDFNNMLGIIIGHTELALGGVKPGDPLAANLREIRKAADRSADLTRQLLAFARKQIVAPRVLDLNETLEGMLKMLRTLIGEQIDLAWLPGKEVWPVRIDPSQVDQILANLCVNARDAIADVGRIAIETKNATFDEAYCSLHPDSRPGDFVMLAVSDNGAGMDRETLDRIFEPFFTTKGVGKGTGLGLATVYGIVKQNDGFVNVYSEPGTGTTFRIYLPRQSSGEGRSPEDGTAAPVAGGRETVLLVEDQPEILAIARMMLEKFGYRVIAASTPEEALRIAGEHRGGIDLLISDVIMPGMNGRQLAENISSLHPKVRRLFMSGYTDDVIAHHGVLDEGVHFIQKPFTVQSFAAKVREALDGGAGESAFGNAPSSPG
jgi:PAS domain S-box-containing protein